MTDRPSGPPPRPGWSLVALLLLAVVVPVTAGTASAASDIAITNVTVSTERPAPGQLVELRTTVRSATNQSEAVEITDVYVRPEDGPGDKARVENIGTVTGGQRLTVPLTLSFDDSGVKNLRVFVIGRTPDGEFVQRKYPLTVVVGGDGPGLNVRAENPSIGGETAISVNVTNGAAEEIRDVRLVVDGSNVAVENPRRIAAGLGPGTERSFTYTATFLRNTSSTLDATLQYTTASGQTRTVSERVTVGTDRLSATGERPQVELSVQDAVPGATRPVNVTVANGLDREVRQLRVVATSPEAAFVVRERVRANLSSGEAVTLSFPASVAEAGTHPVNVTLVYTDEGVRRRMTRTFQASFGAPPNPAEVTLTSVEAVATGGSVEISATAGNVGSTEAAAVVASVGNASELGSANYFVGDIDPSDFASFTLRTSVDGNVSSIPLEVRYVVDGVERTATTEVPVERRVVERPPRSGSGGGFPVVPAVGLLVVLVLGAVGYRKWR
jgi:hypothetical protein